MSLDDAIAESRRLVAEREASLASAWASVARRAFGDARRALLEHGPHQQAAADPGWRPPDADELLDPTALAEHARQRVGRRNEAIVRASVEPILDDADVGITWDEASPRVAPILARMGLHITSIAQTMRDDVMRELADAYEAGESIDQAAERLTVLAGAARQTGERIARTETVGASNAGSLAAVELTGAADSKTWVATMDDRTRDTHADADGQTVALSATFDVGGAALAYPGDPDGPSEEVVNCRCTLVYDGGSPSQEASMSGKREAPKGSLPATGGLAAPHVIVRPDFSAVERAVREQVRAGVTAAVDAAAPAADEQATVDGIAWGGPIALVDTPTGDGRMLDSAGWTTRDLPLTLMAQRATPGDYDGGHAGATVAGRIDSIQLVGSEAIADGVFDSEPGSDGADFARMVGQGYVTGVSVDVALRSYETAIERADGSVDRDADPEEVWELFWGDSADGDRLLAIFTEYQIMGATVVNFPAFEDARIALTAGAAPVPVERLGERHWMATDLEHGRARIFSPLTLTTALTASAAGIAPAAPPRAWFEVPEPAELTPFTVLDSGQCFGHIAPWGTCHVGYPDGCVDAPHTKSGYAYFHTGEVLCDDGSRVAVGRCSVGGGHASLGLTRSQTAHHYDDASSTVAVLTAAEGRHGVWCCGSVVPEADASMVAQLRRHPPSGDWRGVNGNLELIHVLAVNSGGFPVPRSRTVIVASADGSTRRETIALVAAGALQRSPDDAARFARRAAAARRLEPAGARRARQAARLAGRR